MVLLRRSKKKEFSNDIASIITKEMLIDSSRDVTTIKIDLKLSILKPLHLNTLIQILNYFKTSDVESIIKSGFQATGITNAIAISMTRDMPSLNRYIDSIL